MFGVLIPIKELDMWWKGLTFLHSEENCWLKDQSNLEVTLSDMRKDKAEHNLETGVFFHSVTAVRKICIGTNRRST